MEYFVSAMDGPNRLYYMAGPYATHEEALAIKERVFQIANAHDPRSWFMSWGTVSVPDGSGKIGSVNFLLDTQRVG